jgi:hypothetical protein
VQEGAVDAKAYTHDIQAAVTRDSSAHAAHAAAAQAEKKDGPTRPPAAQAHERLSAAGAASESGSSSSLGRDSYRSLASSFFHDAESSIASGSLDCFFDADAPSDGESSSQSLAAADEPSAPDGHHHRRQQHQHQHLCTWQGLSTDAPAAATAAPAVYEAPSRPSEAWHAAAAKLEAAAAAAGETLPQYVLRRYKQVRRGFGAAQGCIDRGWWRCEWHGSAATVASLGSSFRHVG